MNDEIKKIKDLLEIQGKSGNWDYDFYMVGLYNGLELAISVLENRKPKYRTLPKRNDDNENNN